MARPGRESPLITLLSDFGLEDVYAGVMKGVIASIAPRTSVIDISHGVAPQDLLQGGLRWAAAVDFFPRGSVHVAVVDPGVGGPRAILAARVRGSIFLAPDNGLIGFVARAEEIQEAVWVEESRYFLSKVSRTFHGRDIFAPVAAHLSLGLSFSRLGPPARDFVRTGPPPLGVSPVRGGERIQGQIVDIDKFGNCITNISAEAALEGLRDIRVGKRRFPALVESYGAKPPGHPLVIVGSSGCLEIAVNRGRADRALGLRRGQRVTAFSPRDPRGRGPRRT